jgi:hypothetical protein
MPKENIAGPTVLWSELKDKKVKSNDDKELGRIKTITQNHFRIKKGSLRKSSFWVPKNLADAYDGKNVWLVNDEKDIHDKFFYGEEPPDSVEGAGSPVGDDRIKKVDKRMAGIPSKPTGGPKGYENIRDNK